MRIAVNGFGPIGRALALRVNGVHGIELAAINEVAFPIEESRRLLSQMAPSESSPVASANAPDELLLGGRSVAWLRIDRPEELPWAELGIDVVIEAAQFFARSEMLAQTDGGRIRVLMTGDLREGLPDITIVPCVNQEQFRPEHVVLCAGSDRTQSLCPVLFLLDRALGLETFQFAIHRPPYGNREWLVGPRPTDIEQLARVMPELARRGRAFRIEDPHAAQATVWLEAMLGRKASAGEVGEVFASAAAGRFSGVVLAGEQHRCAAGDRHSCLVDLARLHAKDHRVWMEIRYDPVVSYVERLYDILTYLASVT
ncbi:MAG: hypothetical protein HUU20_23075 [Pirellulales bacterium]|nr:hypothetical protein [Pirellulales bacterium]